jgi:hypothetical protein
VLKKKGGNFYSTFSFSIIKNENAITMMGKNRPIRGTNRGGKKDEIILCLY